MKVFKIICLSVVVVLLMAVDGDGCNNRQTSDDIQRAQQERILQEGTSAIGMPAITNFQEKRILKSIIELRDQKGYVTYTYIFSEYLGKFIYVGQSIGYGISAATQFTNPQKIEHPYQGVWNPLPQADPNGLFSPATAEGTWVLMKDPKGKDVVPCYFETRITVTPFKLPADKVIGDY